MNTEESYGREYFEGIYTHLKKEKKLVLQSFFDLLVSEKKEIRKILDLGCGEGEFLELCAEKGLSCFGVDISDYALKKARKKIGAKLEKLDLEQEKLPWPSDFFDAVTSFDLVEHLENPELVLKESQRVLKKDGVLFLTTPNADYWPADFFGHFVSHDPTHVNLQGERYWQEKLKKAGFKEIKIKGCFLFGFPPILNLRFFLRRLRIPVLTKPLFLPVIGLASGLFIFARK